MLAEKDALQVVLKGRTFGGAEQALYFLSFRVGFSPRGICFPIFFSNLYSPLGSRPKIDSLGPLLRRTVCWHLLVDRDPRLRIRRFLPPQYCCSGERERSHGPHWRHRTRHKRVRDLIRHPERPVARTQLVHHVGKVVRIQISTDRNLSGWIWAGLLQRYNLRLGDDADLASRVV